MTPVILVARRADNGHRDALWSFAKRRWQAMLPDVPIVEGFHDGPEPFSFSAAINAAYRVAASELSFDTVVYVGSDWMLDTADHFWKACGMALRQNQMVFPHSQTVVIGEEATRNILRLTDPLTPLGIETPRDGSHHTNTFSGVVCASRQMWDAVGGFDERFQRWSFEDLSWTEACNCIGGPSPRVHGTLYHLWHPQIWEEREGNPDHNKNMLLWERYKECRGNPSAMRALLSEPGGPLA